MNRAHTNTPIAAIPSPAASASPTVPFPQTTPISPSPQATQPQGNPSPQGTPSPDPSPQATPFPQSAPFPPTSSALQDRLVMSARDAIDDILQRVEGVERRVLGELSRFLWPRLERAIRGADDAQLREELMRWRKRIDEVLQDGTTHPNASHAGRPSRQRRPARRTNRSRMVRSIR
ncbi:MAG: hypothetical protein K6T81_04920 [Alicyclobacillus macrosporangiidus]|uniref:hypothetical protein n=1 Tax=Alicyclobacillus macrosporangiidus TaxID=392015 RepID=UPI0026E94DEC|nr:hypothetical protein [Alicyclobacillus macrosporangiidus]MCL6598063.1 hypothetical protein [Alicyclobacillus macrosporangiidus]